MATMAVPPKRAQLPIKQQTTTRFMAFTQERYGWLPCSEKGVPIGQTCTGIVDGKNPGHEGKCAVGPGEVKFHSSKKEEYSQTKQAGRLSRSEKSNGVGQFAEIRLFEKSRKLVAQELLSAQTLAWTKLVNKQNRCERSCSVFFSADARSLITLIATE